MKRHFAKYANGMLVAMATVFVTTACIWYFHRPEAPAELMKK